MVDVVGSEERRGVVCARFILGTGGESMSPIFVYITFAAMFCVSDFSIHACKARNCANRAKSAAPHHLPSKMLCRRENRPKPPLSLIHANRS